MDKHLKRFFIAALIVAFILTFVYFLVTKSSGYSSISGEEDSEDAEDDESGGEWTVYGTKSCGWTVKQLKEMDSKNVSYTFVDCDTQDCPGVKGFPTLKNTDGTVKTGFTPM